MSDVTRIRGRIEQGEPRAAEDLLPLIYRELRQMAAAKMARERPGQTLQPTALVHEVWLRLSKESRSEWKNREQFFAMAAEVMRRILVDRARRRRSQKHGGDLARMELDAVDVPFASSDDLVLRVHEALERLATQDSEKAEVVKLRFFRWPGECRSRNAFGHLGKDRATPLGFRQGMAGASDPGSCLAAVLLGAPISRHEQELL